MCSSVPCYKRCVFCVTADPLLFRDAACSALGGLVFLIANTRDCLRPSFWAQSGCCSLKRWVPMLFEARSVWSDLQLTLQDQCLAGVPLPCGRRGAGQRGARLQGSRGAGPFIQRQRRQPLGFLNTKCTQQETCRHRLCVGVMKNRTFEHSLSKATWILLSQETPLQIQIFFTQSVNKTKLICSLIFITGILEQVVLRWVFVGRETPRDLFPSKHLQENKASLVGLVSFVFIFPRSEYLACDSFLLNFLNNVESRIWLSIKHLKRRIQ